MAKQIAPPDKTYRLWPGTNPVVVPAKDTAYGTGNIETVIAKGNVPDGQPLDSTCSSFTASLKAGYKAGAPIVSVPVTGCIDARKLGQESSVAWR